MATKAATEHTATPWELVNDSGPFTEIYIESEPLGWKSGPIAIVRPVSGDCDTARANAEHIIRCVNSHDDLVKACEYVMKWFAAWSVECGPAEDELFERLQAAIDKAERD